MLLEFTAKNFRSIKDEITLSLVKSKRSGLEANSFQPQDTRLPPILLSAAIYGPNAAGKSNIVRALAVMRKIIQRSAEESQRGKKLSLSPYAFNSKTKLAPSEFEVIFIAGDNVRYQYGFAATEDRIFGEWLLAFPKGLPQRWFSRAYESDSDSYTWELGDKLRGKKQTWKEATRSNALFLSTAIQLNSEQLRPVFDWFSKHLRVVGIGGWNPLFSISLCEKPNSKTRILDMLRAADIGITDIQLQKEKFDPGKLNPDMPLEIKRRIIEEMEGEDIVDLRAIHDTEKGDRFELDFDEESDGTKKLFAFAGPWLDTLDNGYILVIDELHDNFHPHIVEFLVKLFHDKRVNTKNAQLIFTTHETSILSQEIFRIDQVWFCEKKDYQATQLYPLTDFSPRKGYENLEKNYLEGRYGAIPHISRLKEAMEF